MNENKITQNGCSSGNEKCNCAVKERCGEKVLCEEEVREIYRNLMAGKDSVETLRPMSEDSAFREVLLRQDQAYSEFCSRVESYASDHDYKLKDLSVFAKGMMHMSASINALTDKSPSKLASIMLQGINMGVISITKIVNKLHDDGCGCPLAEDMLKMLKHNAEEMKRFL